MTSLINFLNNSFYTPQDHMGSKDPATALMENEIILNNLKMIRNNLKMILKYFCINLLFLFLISLIVFLYLKSNVVVYAITLEEYKTQIRAYSLNNGFFLEDNALRFKLQYDEKIYPEILDFHELHVNYKNRRSITKLISNCSSGIFYNFTLFDLNKVNILPEITVEKDLFSFMDYFYSFMNYFFNYHITTYEEQDDILKRKISLIAECREFFVNLSQKECLDRKEMLLFSDKNITKVEYKYHLKIQKHYYYSFSTAFYGSEIQKPFESYNNLVFTYPGKIYMTDLNRCLMNCCLILSEDPVAQYKNMFMPNKQIFVQMIFNQGKFPPAQPIEVILFNFNRNFQVANFFHVEYRDFIPKLFGLVREFNQLVNEDYDRKNLNSLLSFSTFMCLFRNI